MVRYDESTADEGAQYVEDRRSVGGGGGGGGFGTGRKVGTGVAAGGGLIGIVIAIIAALTGGGGSGFTIGQSSAFDQKGAVANTGPAQVVDPQADTVKYLQFLMKDIQDTWSEYFDRAGQQYTSTTLILFTDAIDTGCGQASSAVGPFYCPAPGDHHVYLDLGFFDELATRFQSPGDFAQAYVVAHEMGHHIQSLTGISDAVNQAMAQHPDQKNEYSVRQELQADCLAGVWANSASKRLTKDTGRPIIESGDIAEGLQAAQSVGDDRLQAQAGVRVNAETWTHGSAAQREKWFRTGFDSGDPEKCDTFGASSV